MEHKFVQYTLGKQIELVNIVQQIQNDDYILFDKNFKSVKIEMVGQYRVEVDESGRKAFLSTGAQFAFDCDKYWSYVSETPLVIRRNDVVILRKS